MFPAGEIDSSEMENQDAVRLASFRESIGFSDANEDGFSDSSSYEGGQHKMRIGLTEPHLWESRENSPNCDPDEFAPIEDRSFSGLWMR